MKILSFNPGHDGAFAYLEDGHLIVSAEAEKNSNYRHSPVSIPDLFDVLGDLNGMPDVICRSGWWPDSVNLYEQTKSSGYYGFKSEEILVGEQKFIGKTVSSFSSSHERSHILCAFGMSSLPVGTRCYALIWEGVIGAFYDIDSDLNISKNWNCDA